jgi:uncharacterized protein
MNEEQWLPLRTLVISQFPLHPRWSPHAPDHWDRVERYGLFLCRNIDADLKVVRLFSLFHDSRRLEEGEDPGHGTRAAELVQELCGAVFDLEPGQLEMLLLACRDHEHGKTSLNLTVGACWDADRLDLDRVGMVTEPRYMSTGPGCALAALHPRERRKRAGIIA